MVTETRSVHTLKVGDIVAAFDTRLAVTAVTVNQVPIFELGRAAHHPDAPKRDKTIITWVELVADGEQAKTEWISPGAIGVYKTEDHTFEVEVS